MISYEVHSLNYMQLHLSVSKIAINIIFDFLHCIFSLINKNTLYNKQVMYVVCYLSCSPSFLSANMNVRVREP